MKAGGGQHGRSRSPAAENIVRIGHQSLSAPVFVDDSESKSLTVFDDHSPAVSSETLPSLIEAAGSAARFAYEEFFFGRLRNEHTRRAYRHAVHRFLDWCQSRQVILPHVSPRHVGEYLDAHAGSPATRKQHLAALRHFFDELVTRHVVILNPAASVRGERYQVIEGKTPEIPVRHDLEGFLFAYIAAATIETAEKGTPLFRSAIRRTGQLTGTRLTATDISRMVKRRMKQAGLPTRLSPHSFRVTTITDLLAQGVPLEDVQYLAGHADPRTTRLYDRRQRRVTRNIVERISI